MYIYMYNYVYTKIIEAEFMKAKRRAMSEQKISKSSQHDVSKKIHFYIMVYQSFKLCAIMALLQLNLFSDN